MFQDKAKSNAPMRLMPYSVNHLSVFLEMQKPILNDVPTLVNCVDASTGEIVYSWLLIVDTVA